VGRPERFSRKRIVESAASVAAVFGPAATMSAIASALGGPTGSIYHRFGSREELLAEMWVDIAESFQAQFIDLLDGSGDPLDVAIQAALHTPRWVRLNPSKARIFFHYRRDDFVPSVVSNELRVRLDHLRVGLRSGVLGFCERAFGGISPDLIEVCALVLIDLPAAVVRRHLVSARPLPSQVDSLLELSVRAILLADPAIEPAEIAG
jgi:AcrR family transcriptional regulator